MDIFILIFTCILLPFSSFFGGGECKDPSHSLFSGFVYSYLGILFHPHTVNILNISYYLTIERDLVQVGLRSKDQFPYTGPGRSFHLLIRLTQPCTLPYQWAMSFCGASVCVTK